LGKSFVFERTAPVRFAEQVFFVGMIVDLNLLAVDFYIW
tara:strand:- start:360949 stop:361065 length:117 start_codon:yes stop_codon:yes gene_type:complete